MSRKQRAKLDAEFSDLDNHSVRQRQKSLGGTPSPKTPGTAREERSGNLNPFDAVQLQSSNTKMTSTQTKSNLGGGGGATLRDPPAMEAPKESVVSRVCVSSIVDWYGDKS